MLCLRVINLPAMLSLLVNVRFYHVLLLSIDQQQLVLSQTLPIVDIHHI